MYLHVHVCSFPSPPLTYCQDYPFPNRHWTHYMYVCRLFVHVGRLVLVTRWWSSLGQKLKPHWRQFDTCNPPYSILLARYEWSTCRCVLIEGSCICEGSPLVSWGKGRRMGGRVGGGGGGGVGVMGYELEWGEVGQSQEMEYWGGGGGGGGGRGGCTGGKPGCIMSWLHSLQRQMSMYVICYDCYQSFAARQVVLIDVCNYALFG